MTRVRNLFVAGLRRDRLAHTRIEDMPFGGHRVFLMENKM